MPSGDAWLKTAQDRFEEGERLLQEARDTRWWRISRRIKLYREATHQFRRSQFCSQQASMSYRSGTNA
jgi:hypothetical protein